MYFFENTHVSQVAGRKKPKHGTIHIREQCQDTEKLNAAATGLRPQRTRHCTKRALVKTINDEMKDGHHEEDKTAAARGGLHLALHFSLAGLAGLARHT